MLLVLAFLQKTLQNCRIGYYHGPLQKTHYILDVSNLPNQIEQIKNIFP